MQFNSREGFILTTALVAVTVLVTILLHNKVNNAIERRAKSLTSNELKTFGNIVNKPSRQLQAQPTNAPIESVAPISEVPQNSEIQNKSPPPSTTPPVGSGRKWTPL